MIVTIIIVIIIIFIIIIVIYLFLLASHMIQCISWETKGIQYNRVTNEYGLR